jgi:hypothetical protein
MPDISALLFLFVVIGLVRLLNKWMQQPCTDCVEARKHVHTKSRTDASKIIWLGFFYFIVSSSSAITIQQYKEEATCEAVRYTVHSELSDNLGLSVSQHCFDSHFIYPIPRGWTVLPQLQ